MLENDLLGDFLKLARPVLERTDGGVLFKHHDPLTSGIPDVSISLRVVSWLEFKCGKQIKWTNDLQRLTCHRLCAATGRCWVVFYQEKGNWKTTYIIRALDVDRNGQFDQAISRMAEGFDHQFVLDFIRQVHA